MAITGHDVFTLEKEFDRMKQGGRKIRKAARGARYFHQESIDRRKERKLKQAMRYA